MNEIIVLLLVLALILLLVLTWREFLNSKNTALLAQLEDKHRAMLQDLNDGLNKLGDRLSFASQDSGEKLKQTVSLELQQTRDAMHGLKLAQTENLSKNREELLEKLNQAFERLNKTVEGRLDLISGKVSERLDEGFKKTTETFTSVMAHLSKIDEAQKKIDGLATNVVSLQDLLSDKRSRGAFGEVQLESLVKNSLPPNAYQFQYSLGENKRVDCMLFLPEPTGNVAVDSKFPLENYHRMFEASSAETDRAAAKRQFKADVKKHVDDIAKKYIIPNVTSDGAVMFIPAEAVFAEIHAYHSEIITYAMAKRVWLVSPTTLMAVLNTARAVLKDTEMRKQVHIIQAELGKLSKDFGLFDKRMKSLADHIRQAGKDVEDVHISSKKITEGFAKIERVELSNAPIDLLDVVDDNVDE